MSNFKFELFFELISEEYSMVCASVENQLTAVKHGPIGQIQCTVWLGHVSALHFTEDFYRETLCPGNFLC